MKVKILIFLVLFLGMTVFVSAQRRPSAPAINDAVADCAKMLEGRMLTGDRVAVLNFTSPSTRFSDYVMNRMMSSLVNSGKVKVVDRQELDLVQKEMAFQYSGEVSDESAQAIGKKLGAKAIISGYLEDLGDNYLIQFKAIQVEDASVLSMPDSPVAKDNQMATLLAGTAVAVPTMPPQQYAPAQQPAAVLPQTPQYSQNPLSRTGYPNGLNYSGSYKFLCGFVLNPFVGLGSFLMGDVAGGIIVGGLEVLGIVLMNLYYPVESHSYYYDPYFGDSSSTLESGSYVGFGVGVVSLVAGVIYGWFRPFSYDKSLAQQNGTYYVRSDNPLDRIGLTMVKNDRDSNALRITYSLEF